MQCMMGSACLVGWLNVFNAGLPPRRSLGGDRDPWRWEEWETVPYATLSPPA